MSERSAARYSFIWRRRLRSTAMWFIRWLSASTAFLALLCRRRRFLRTCCTPLSPFAWDAIAAAGGTSTGAALPKRKLPVPAEAAHAAAAALKVS
jgi:hypothetical protein